ncbi:hypothetical protein HYDPIDRAFT_173488 [Hydnomerulius pinastri MD-312]|nr:hypothetical protein HYDPIDRAFT_173488 [Hydnomerulius pinastri MD-312]
MTHSAQWPGDDERFSLPVLAPILPHFFIPRLDDKPQDPIVQTIDLDRTTALPELSLYSLPTTLVPPHHPVPPLEPLPQTTKPVLSLWSQAAIHRSQDVDHAVSWDAARKHKETTNPKTPFLTEQSPSVFDSVQRQVQPTFLKKHTKVIRVPEIRLIDSLRLVVLGTSSSLHVWDAASQLFVQAGSLETKPMTLLIESKNDVMTQSILQRFLHLGTLVRRLELFVCYLRSSLNSTVHAFAHGLSTLLMFIRDRLSHGPLFQTGNLSDNSCLATVWLHYEDSEQMISSLASMCYRSIDIKPENYTDFPTSPVDLLSLVYETFETHVERGSPCNITAVMAYVLTVSSKPYIQDLCKLVAYGEAGHRHAVIGEKLQSMDATALFEGDDPHGPWNEEDSVIDTDGPFPGFIPPDLANIISAAHKSLKLLEAAQPSHPILTSESASKDIQWIWTEDGLNTAWNGALVTSKDRRAEVAQPHLTDAAVEQPVDDYKPELAEFRIFDLEPGSSNLRESSERTPQTLLHEFIASFPTTLPTITPSPSLLCELLFSPLSSHAASISHALLAAFLDQTSFLSIEAHLILLRSHMLLTSHSFKSRLIAALFSDADSRESHGINLLRHKSKGAPAPEQSYTGHWAVGLAPFLMTKDTWPPTGADLSFLLRTVIVDSQEPRDTSTSDAPTSTDGVHRVTDEAEFRLGFAIRELPGRDRWLDPLCKALDFLYLDYKVPHPLDVLIPPTLLSKYQRVFALLLRLTRVECAIRSVFRLTRAKSDPILPTFSSSNKLLLQFRFVAHAFVNTLSTYLYDTAIGGNFDAFLSRIAACRNTLNAPSDFRDVFTLAECHSAVLDEILSACLLRSTQRAAGDLLRGTLQLVLDFCVLVGDLKDGRLQEYQATSSLEAMHAAFRKKVSTLTKALEVLLEKDAKLARPEDLLATHVEGEHRIPPGGIEALRHFLTRLDISDWWKEW